MMEMEYHNGMDTDSSVLLLFIITATGVVTYWFILGLLNTFIKNSFSIIGCAFSVLLTFFFSCLNRFFIKPVRKIIQSIHIPLGIKIVFYLLIGIGIFVLDHMYGTTFYEMDETTFHHFLFQGKTYWITEQALYIGGFFIGLGLFLTLVQFLKALFTFLDKPISLVFTFQK